MALHCPRRQTQTPSPLPLPMLSCSSISSGLWPTIFLGRCPSALGPRALPGFRSLQLRRLTCWATGPVADIRSSARPPVSSPPETLRRLLRRRAGESRPGCGFHPRPKVVSSNRRIFRSSGNLGSALEVWPESPLSGFALRERDVFQSYTA